MRLWRSLALIAFSLVALAPPAFARGHSAASHRASHQHSRFRDGLAWSHRHAVHPDRRYALRNRGRVYAFAPWQQQQHFADYQSFDGYNKPYAERFNDRYSGRRYQARWNRAPVTEPSFGESSQFQGMAEQAASANGVPVSLVNRVIRRESGGNSRAVSRGNYGLMQIRLGTARAMGYSGSAAGLLDPATNVTYAVRYLAGAYRAAGGNESRAVALYARGYNATPRLQEAAY
jgi:soluble lytic murein transglycosylase-like protein